MFCLTYLTMHFPSQVSRVFGHLEHVSSPLKWFDHHVVDIGVRNVTQEVPEACTLLTKWPSHNSCAHVV